MEWLPRLASELTGGPMRLTRLTVQVLLPLTFFAAPLSVEAQPLQQVDIGFAVLLVLVVPIGLILGAWAGYVIGRWYGVVRGLHVAWVRTLVGTGLEHLLLREGSADSVILAFDEHGRPRLTP
jgi:membrane protein DedA with SNARE-associated domain